MVLLLVGGVFLCGKPPALQVFAIVALAPWAFVGFEAVSHSSAEFGFSFKKLWRVLVAAIAASAAMYAMLAVFPRNSAITAGSAGFWYNIHFMAKKGDEYS